MTFEAWLRQFIQRHPVKPMKAGDREPFTAGVMRRVREQPALRPLPSREAFVASWARWLTPVRISFATAAAAAGLLVVVVISRPAYSRRLAKEISQATEILASFNESEPLLENDVETLANEVDASERARMLSENNIATDDTRWIEQMSQGLNQIDDSVGVNGAADSTDANWQDEWQMLDETELSSS